MGNYFLVCANQRKSKYLVEQGARREQQSGCPCSCGVIISINNSGEVPYYNNTSYNCFVPMPIQPIPSLRGDYGMKEDWYALAVQSQISF